MSRILRIALVGLFIAVAFSILPGVAAADGLPVFESAMNDTMPGWILGGSAYLTSGVDDLSGQGWLRLTGIGNNEFGYAYYDTAFHSSYGIVVSFEYTAWGGSGADGIAFFLFDGTTTSQQFQIGDAGGSLGYANGCGAIPGLSNAYVGIGIDEWGNFAAYDSARCHHGYYQQNKLPDSVAIRGSGNSTGDGDPNSYYYQTTTGTLSQGIDITGMTTRPSQTGPYYRKVFMTITPDKKLTLSIQFGAGNPATELITDYDLTTGTGMVPLPDTLKLGFSASTGGSTNYHEIRNISVAVPADLEITKTDGQTSVVPGDPITYTVMVTNNGPNDLRLEYSTGAVMTDNVPIDITNVTWTAAASPGSVIGQYSGAGNNIQTTVNLLNGGNATFTINGTISPTLSGPLINTATITPPVYINDPNPNNNTATDTDTVFPAVTTNAASGVLATTATLNGDLTSMGSASSVDVYFEYGLTASYGSQTTPQPVSTTGTFNATITGLSPNTTYHFRAVAAGDGTTYGNDMTFTTGTDPPAVTTNAATGIGTNSATLNGDLTDRGSASSVDVYFEWGETISYGQQTTPQTVYTTGTFNTPISGLNPYTTYHFRARAVGDGTAVGGDIEFTTTSTPPTVTTYGSSNVATYSATLHGNLTSRGTASSVNASFEYATDDYYTTHGNTYIQETPPVTLNSTGSYNSPALNLQPGTLYHFRAKAAGHGTAYGSDMTFTTTTDPPEVTTLGATNIIFDSARLNGNLTSLGSVTYLNPPDDEIDVTFEWATDAHYTANGNTYNNETSPPWPMTEPGTFSFNLYSLSSGTTYHYRAKASGAHGTGYGVDTTFTTDAYLTINSSTGGSVTQPGEGTFGYDASTVINLLADPTPNYHFVNWSGDTSTIIDVNDPSTTITMNSDYSITANFAPDQYTLTVNIIGSGSVTKNPDQATYAYNDVVQLTANPDLGWSFSSWSGDLSGSANPDSITMNGDKTITTTFSLITYPVDVSSNPPAGGTVNPGTGQYVGTTVFEALPNPGYMFVNWTINGVTGETNNPLTLDIQAATTLVANFTLIIPPTVTTNAAADVTASTATLHGYLDSLGTASSVDVTFEWATDAYYTTHGNTYDNETTPPWSMVLNGPFSFALSGLSSDTTYHFRAKATGHGIAYGADMTFTIPPQPPNQPPNISPGDGATCVSLPVTLQSAPFSDPDAGDTHSASQWQVRTDTGSYTSPVYDSGTDTSNLTSVTLTTAELDHVTDYYWRVKHQDNRGAWSTWSVETHFKTADTPVGLDVTVTPDNTNVNYNQVTIDGCTYVARSNETPAGHAEPETPRIGPFVDITTTATHSGTTTVGLPLSGGGQYYEPSGIRMYHWNGTLWEDVTTWVDTDNNIIYGEVPSLSWFYIGGQWVYVGPSVPAFPNIYIGIAAALVAGILAFLIRRKLIYRG